MTGAFIILSLLSAVAMILELGGSEALWSLLRLLGLLILVLLLRVIVEVRFGYTSSLSIVKVAFRSTLSIYISSSRLFVTTFGPL